MIRFSLLATLFLLFSMQSISQGSDPKYPPLLIVAQDGSGNYETIQEAVNSVRDLGQQRVTIYIRKGTYHEKLIVPSWKTAISLIGDSTGTVTITNADYSGKPVPKASLPFGTGFPE